MGCIASKRLFDFSDFNVYPDHDLEPGIFFTEFLPLRDESV